MKAACAVAVLSVLSLALVAGCGASSGGGPLDEVGARTIYFVKAWSDPGLGYVGGIAVDGSSKVYALDRTHRSVAKYGPGGDYIRSWGSSGSGNGQFLLPLHVDVGPDGTVSVTDADRHDVQQFTPGGTFLRKFGGNGTADGQFKYAQGIGANPVTGVLYVSDGGWTGLNRIQKFSPEGSFILKWGTAGSLAGQFDQPEGVAVDAPGNVYVADGLGGNRRIQKFTENGLFKTKWGKSGPGQFSLASPQDVATDFRNNVWAVDTWGYRIERFKAFGLWKETFNVGYGFPEAIAVSSSDYIYVASSGGRVQKLARWITYHQGQADE